LELELCQIVKNSLSAHVNQSELHIVVLLTRLFESTPVAGERL
jgi:hypothetical protein